MGGLPAGVGVGVREDFLEAASQRTPARRAAGWEGRAVPQAERQVRCWRARGDLAGNKATVGGRVRAQPRLVPWMETPEGAQPHPGQAGGQ